MIFLRKLLREWLTGPGSSEYEIVRALTALSVISAISLKVYDVVWLHNPLSVTDFGVGLGGLIAGAGIGQSFKDKGAATAVATGA